MRKTVGMLALFLTFTLILPGLSSAEENHPRKYAIDFNLGGGYHMMQDINDYIPADFTGYSPNKINIGTQLGIGICYRYLEDFGYQIGYNALAAGVPVAYDQKYEVTATFPGAAYESWAEQTVSGWEFYALAVWYKSMGSSELSFGVGPAIYGAKLDRSIDIVRDASGSHLTGGSFYNAEGKALGLILALGFEFPIGANTGLLIQGGGRFANVGKLMYDDPSAQKFDQLVYLNPGTGAPLGVDFSGGFLKFTFRAYFKPDSKWLDAD